MAVDVSMGGEVNGCAPQAERVGVIKGQEEVFWWYFDGELIFFVDDAGDEEVTFGGCDVGQVDAEMDGHTGGTREVGVCADFG